MMDLDRSKVFFIIGLLIILAFAGGMKYADIRGQSAASDELVLEDMNRSEVPPTSNENSSKIKVYLIGEVEKPGVYEVQQGTRLYEVVELGVVTDGADLTRINLARRVVDEEVIVVPSFEAAIESNSLPVDATGFSAGEDFTSLLGPSGQQDGKVNLNTASVQELDDKLPGIGPTLAGRIVTYRENNGGFRQVEDIRQVSGIGEKRFEDIKDLICVR
ncbi:MAG: ComEA family DNA-binding protein [Bacillota bacterium]|nr:ComEA family DNA-binding protein [Bacillota bacterium]